MSPNHPNNLRPTATHARRARFLASRPNRAVGRHDVPQRHLRPCGGSRSQHAAGRFGTTAFRRSAAAPGTLHGRNGSSRIETTLVGVFNRQDVPWRARGRTLARVGGGRRRCRICRDSRGCGVSAAQRAGCHSSGRVARCCRRGPVVDAVTSIELAGGGDMAIHVEAVESIDSAGIRALFHAEALVRVHGGLLVLVSPSRGVQLALDEEAVGEQFQVESEAGHP